jgi:hypothetical protein
MEKGPIKFETSASFVDNGQLNPSPKTQTTVSLMGSTSMSGGTKESAEIFLRGNINNPDNNKGVKITETVPLASFLVGGLYLKATHDASGNMQALEVGYQSSPPKAKVEVALPVVKTD